jgi:hypothetical protein
MKGVAAGGHRQVDDTVGVEVARYGIRADVIGFVGLFEMQTMAVGVGIDRHRSDSHLGAGADDAYCDFAAIGNKYLIYQGSCRLWLAISSHHPRGEGKKSPLPDARTDEFLLPFIVFLIASGIVLGTADVSTEKPG